MCLLNQISEDKKTRLLCKKIIQNGSLIRDRCTDKTSNITQDKFNQSDNIEAFSPFLLCPYLLFFLHLSYPLLFPSSCFFLFLSCLISSYYCSILLLSCSVSLQYVVNMSMIYPLNKNVHAKISVTTKFHAPQSIT